MFLILREGWSFNTILLASDGFQPASTQSEVKPVRSKKEK